MGKLVLNFQKFKKLSARVLNLFTNKLNVHCNANKYNPQHPGDKYEHWSSAIRYDNISLEDALNLRGQKEHFDAKCSSLVLSSDSTKADKGYQVDAAAAQTVFQNAISYAASIGEGSVRILGGTYTFTGTLDCDQYIEVVGESRDSVTFQGDFANSDGFRLSKGTFRDITFSSIGGTYFIGMDEYTDDKYPIDLVFDHCRFEFRTDGDTAGIYIRLTSDNEYYPYSRIVFNDCEFVTYQEGAGGTFGRGLIYTRNDTTTPLYLMFNKCDFKFGTVTIDENDAWVSMSCEANRNMGYTGWGSIESTVDKMSFYRCNFYECTPAAVTVHSPIIARHAAVEIYHCNIATKYSYCVESNPAPSGLGITFARMFYNNFKTAYGVFSLGDYGFYNSNLNTIAYFYNISSDDFPKTNPISLILHGDTNIIRGLTANTLHQDEVHY